MWLAMTKIKARISSRLLGQCVHAENAGKVWTGSAVTESLSLFGWVICIDSLRLESRIATEIEIVSYFVAENKLRAVILGGTTKTLTNHTALCS